MYKILAVPNQNSYDFFALKYISNQQYTTSLSWKNLKGFTGHLYKINPEGQTVSAKKNQNGNFVGDINFLSKEEYEHISDSSGSNLRMSVTCYTEVTHHYTDWFREYSDGSTEYIDTTYEGATFNEVCHETGTGDPGSGGGSTGGGETYYDYTDKLEINGFFNDYGNLFTIQEENFVRDNPWLVPYLEQYIENGGQDFNPDWPDLGLLGNFFRDIVFDTPEEALFFARYVNGKGDWKISQTMFEDIVTDAEEHDSNANKNYDSQHGSYKRVFNLNGTNSKYELGLGTFTVYYDNSDNPIGLYDEYNWDFHAARYIDYPGSYDREIWRGRTILGISDRTFINEWKTRGMNGVSNFLGEAKSYRIYYP